MKLKHIPNIFTVNNHLDTKISEMPYADGFKIKDVSYSLIQKRQDANNEFKKAKSKIDTHVTIVGIIGLLFFIGCALLSRLSDMNEGNKYATFFILPFAVFFIILRLELMSAKKKRHSPGYLELLSRIRECDREIADSLSVPNDAVRVDIITREVKCRNGKKSSLYEPQLHIMPCHIYKEGEELFITLDGRLYKLPLSCVYDFVLDERSFAYFDRSNITERKRHLFEKYEIRVASRYGNYVSSFAPNLLLDIDGYAYKITFMSYEDQPMSQFFGMEPKDPTINKEN